MLVGTTRASPSSDSFFSYRTCLNRYTSGFAHGSLFYILGEIFDGVNSERKNDLPSLRRKLSEKKDAKNRSSINILIVLSITTWLGILLTFEVNSLTVCGACVLSEDALVDL